MFNFINRWFLLVLLFMLVIIVGCKYSDCCDDCIDVESTEEVQDNRALSSIKKAYTVCVGVENGYAGKCVGSKRDVTMAKGILAKYSKKITALTDKKATKAAVIAQLKEGIKYDLFIFYYSGHGGSMNASADKTEVDGRDEFLCLYDTGLLDNEIWGIISQSKGRVVLLFDCCHSQTMFREPFSFKRQMRKLQASQHLAGSLSMICWSGCPDNSYSYGSSSGGEFTKALKRLYKKKLTYDQLWSKLEADRTLMRYEKVQQTTMGTRFGSNLVFQ